MLDGISKINIIQQSWIKILREDSIIEWINSVVDGQSVGWELSSNRGGAGRFWSGSITLDGQNYELVSQEKPQFI